ncbi:type II toxin-antitoxin system VapB family antitoxin [Actinoplanes oblitus]|uniref:Type II toxin-antitoxin system VapB family antitoxin n=1 Tax=Actinoplanes oblitus TaxID=3040509 RepID=A0ABY8WCZ3_9ACTN|nr:type II toxin-antitoxin system VapB family antitoxin [Actinoplanes oblitus]WIM93585.1 type II toxin-antitoxin system VapB family antitoxin [Actinoplanes oblitus]
MTAADLHLLAAALRADSADVASCTRVLTTVLRDALPPGLVGVDHRRTLADRMRGRPGLPVALTVTTPDEQLVLRQTGHGVHAEIRRVVHGVTIKRTTVDLDDWLLALAAVLSGLATRSAAAREALTRLLG